MKQFTFLVRNHIAHKEVLDLIETRLEIPNEVMGFVGFLETVMNKKGNLEFDTTDTELMEVNKVSRKTIGRKKKSLRDYIQRPNSFGIVSVSQQQDFTTYDLKGLNSIIESASNEVCRQLGNVEMPLSNILQNQTFRQVFIDELAESAKGIPNGYFDERPQTTARRVYT